MGIRQLQWSDLEEVVVSVVKRRYETHEDDEARRRFLRELQWANRQLGRLAQQNIRNDGTRGVNYHSPRIGEAYALRHHLARADNATVVLREFNPLTQVIRAGLCRRLGYLLCKFLRVPQFPRSVRRVRMLDVGSGTGSGAMGMWWDAHSFRAAYGVTHLQVTVVGVEPATPMRAMADAILSDFRDRLSEAEGLDAETARAVYGWEYAAARNLEEACRLSVTPEFDIILFCYTFGLEHAQKGQQTRIDVLRIAKLLRPGGLLCFLTPERPAEKVELMEKVAEALEEAGMLHRRSRLSGYNPHSWWRVSSLAPQKRPFPVLEARRFFNQECQDLQMDRVFGEDPRFDYPYYGLYARCDVFAWK